MVKKLLMDDLIVTRTNKTMTAIKLKDDDELVSVSYSDTDTIIVTNNCYYLRYSSKEIPVVGPKASGVKGIKLDNDYVIYGHDYNINDEYITIFTNKNTVKRIKLTDLKELTRAKKGNMLIKKNKTVEYKVISAFITNSKDSEITELKTSEIPIMDLNSNGSNISKNHIDKFDLKYESVKIINENSKEDNKQMSLEDFTKDFRI